jgi:hypothetical protein
MCTQGGQCDRHILLEECLGVEWTKDRRETTCETEWNEFGYTETDTEAKTSTKIDT